MFNFNVYESQYIFSICKFTTLLKKFVPPNVKKIKI